jgi:hypothetical protein
MALRRYHNSFAQHADSARAVCRSGSVGLMENSPCNKCLCNRRMYEVPTLNLNLWGITTESDLVACHYLINRALIKLDCTSVRDLHCCSLRPIRRRACEQLMSN